MTIFYTSLLLLLLFFLACTEKEKDSPAGKCGDGVCDALEEKKGLCEEDCGLETITASKVAAAGESFVTYVPSKGIGNIAVKVTLPEEPRYTGGAPILVYVSTFFTPQEPIFDTSFTDITKLGFIHVTYLWPGKKEPSGAKSDGTYDYGGKDSLQALRDVIRFASGQIPNSNGDYITQLSEITPLTNNVGLYAFSHPGIAATNVLALYGDDISVAYFVGRENPTNDILSNLELGYYDGSVKIYNPLYSYPVHYSSVAITLDYSSLRYDKTLGVPYFDLNSDGIAEKTDDFIMGTQRPTMYGKKTYSVAMTKALVENGALTDADWPADIATLEEVEELWSFRETVHNYNRFKTGLSDLKVLLVFAQDEHVQPVPDKPSIHQAYDGFTAAGLWVRLNPDQAYVSLLDSTLGALVPDNDANSEPSDWMDIEDWAYPHKAGLTHIVPLAAVAEMSDRVYTSAWDKNIDSVLISPS